MAKTIMVVDDEHHVVEVVRAMLVRKSYQVIVASNGHEALEKLEDARPDLILLDIVMPEMDGATLAEELRKRPETAAIPIVFLTGLLDGKRDTSDKARITGQRMLAKPFDADELFEIIELSLPAGKPAG